MASVFYTSGEANISTPSSNDFDKGAMLCTLWDQSFMAYNLFLKSCKVASAQQFFQQVINLICALIKNDLNWHGTVTE